MGYSGGTGGTRGIDAMSGHRMVHAKFGLTKELERTLPLTRLYWAREKRECCE